MNDKVALFRKYTSLKRFGDKFEFVPVEISCYKNRKLTQNAIKKAERILKKQGVYEFFYTEEVRKFLGLKDYYGIPICDLAESFLYLSDRMKGYRDNVVIVDKKLSFFNKDIFKIIMYLANNFSVYTENAYDGCRLAEYLFYEYGVWINVLPYDKGFGNIKNRYIIDAEKREITIGDVTVDNVEYDVDFGTFDIDLRFMRENSCISDCLSIKNLKSGKNLIKLVDN